MTISFHNAPLVTKTIRTTAAGATELLRWTPELDSASIIRLTVIGTATSGDVVSVVRTWSVIRSDAGTVVAALSAERRFDSGSAAWVVALTNSGTDAVCSVTGEAGHDVTWTGVSVALNGSREIVPFLNQYSVRFNNGVVDELVTTGNFANITKIRTIIEPAAAWSFWFKSSTAAHSVMIGKRNGGVWDAGWEINLTATGGVRLYMVASTQTSMEAAALDWSDGAWHHVVIRCADHSIWIDGVSRMSGSDNGTDQLADATNILNVTFGERADASAPFDGWLDEICYYTTEPSDAGVIWLYNGGAPRDPRKAGAPAGLAHYWRMGDETDVHPTIVDRVGAYDGTMVNMAAGNFELDVPS